MRISEWTQKPPAPEHGDMVVGDWHLAWSPVELLVRTLNGITVYEIGAGQVGAIHLSRGARLATPKRVDVTRFPPRAWETLNVRIQLLPGEAASDVRGGIALPNAKTDPLFIEFSAVLPEASLDGLPWLQTPDVPLLRRSPAVALIGTLCSMGGQIDIGTAQDMPEVAAEPVRFNTHRSIRGVALAHAAIAVPMVVLSLFAGRLDALLIPAILSVVAIGVRKLLVMGRVHVDPARRWIHTKFGFPFSVTRRTYPSRLFSHVEIRPDGPQWQVHLSTGTRSVGINDGLPSARAKALGDQIATALGLPLKSSDAPTGGARRTGRTALFWIPIFLVLLFVGVQIHAKIDNGETGRLGGWSEGHGTPWGHFAHHVWGSVGPHIHELAVSPSGHVVVSADLEESWVWDVPNWSSFGRNQEAGLSGFAFQGEERFTALTRDGDVVVLRVHENTEVDRWPDVVGSDEIWHTSTCSNETGLIEVAVQTDTGVDLWNSTVNTRRPVAQDGRPDAIAWDRACEQLFMLHEKQLQVLHLGSDITRSYALENPAIGNWLAVSNSGERVAYLSEGFVEIGHGTVDGKFWLDHRIEFRVPGDPVVHIAFSPDDVRLFVVSSSGHGVDTQSMIQSWTVEDVASVHIEGPHTRFNSAAWVDTDTIAVGCGDGTIRLWDLYR